MQVQVQYNVKIAKRVLRSLRHHLFPTEQDRLLRKWYLEGGDARLRVEYPLREDSLVLDFGGYKGQWASDIFARYRCEVVVFEPVESFANAIQLRFRNNPRIEVIHGAIGGRTREEVIHLALDGSSIFGASSKQERIRIFDVVEWFASRGLVSRGVDLMKVNIEGGEYELLERMLENGVVDCVQNLQVQFHDVVPGAKERMENIQGQLQKTHHLTYQYRFVWENWERNH